MIDDQNNIVIPVSGISEVKENNASNEKPVSKIGLTWGFNPLSLNIHYFFRRPLL